MMHAVIDIGSNSILMLVAQRDAAGRIEVRHDLARIARLSEGVAERGTLSDEAIQRGLDILSEYRALADDEGATIQAFATEGLRMASDAARFLEPARALLGVAVEIISGQREAEASYVSVAQESEPSAREDLRVIDIGGASTELVVGKDLRVLDMVSHPIGSVRLTERHVQDPTAPISAAAIEAIARDARSALQTQPLTPAPELHGVAGTVTTAAGILLGLQRYDRERVDGQRFGRDEIVAARDRLAAQSLEQRLEHPTLSPKRADVIVAGMTILVEALTHCGAQTLVVRDRGLRYAFIPSGSAEERTQR